MRNVKELRAGRPTALERVDGLVWVGSACSLPSDAVVQERSCSGRQLAPANDRCRCIPATGVNGGQNPRLFDGEYAVLDWVGASSTAGFGFGLGSTSKSKAPAGPPEAPRPRMYPCSVSSNRGGGVANGRRSAPARGGAVARSRAVQMKGWASRALYNTRRCRIKSGATTVHLLGGDDRVAPYTVPMKAVPHQCGALGRFRPALPAQSGGAIGPSSPSVPVRRVPHPGRLVQQLRSRQPVLQPGLLAPDARPRPARSRASLSALARWAHPARRAIPALASAHCAASRAG